MGNSLQILPSFMHFPAEKVSSIGKDWHRSCLKCDKCGKTLTSGGHAEVIFNLVNLNISLLPAVHGELWSFPVLEFKEFVAEVNLIIYWV